MDFLEYLVQKGYFGKMRFTKLPSGFPQIVFSTTVIGLKYSSGVILASDSQATMSNLDKLRERLKKVLRIDKFSALGIAGSPWPGVEIAELLSLYISSLECSSQEELSVESKVELLKGLAKKYFPIALETQGNLFTAMILACYDKEKGGRLFCSFDPVTFLEIKERQYVSIGSGQRFAESYLDGKVTVDLGKEEAISYACEALDYAGKCNAGTGSPPYFFLVISQDGVREPDQEEVEEILKSKERRADG